MLRFRRLPFEVEAFQLSPDGSDDCDAWPAWAREAMAKRWHDVGALFPAIGGPGFHVRIAAGVVRAAPGDWIVRGIDGEIYPVRPEIFAESYVSAE